MKETYENQSSFICSPPVRTDDQDLMIDATELSDEAKAVVGDYLIKANNS